MQLFGVFETGTGDKRYAQGTGAIGGCEPESVPTRETWIKDMLKVLEQLELLHFSDKKIMTILQVDAEQLKSLREMLQEKRAAVTAD